MALERDPYGDARRSAQQAVHDAISMVEMIISGNMSPEKVRWHDPMVQRAIVESLRRLPALERDAQHLAIVKSVFSGAGSQPLKPLPLSGT